MGRVRKKIKSVQPTSEIQRGQTERKEGTPVSNSGSNLFSPTKQRDGKKGGENLPCTIHTHNWPTTTCMHHSFVKKRAPRTKHLEAREQMAEREEMNAEATPQIGSQENEWVILHARRRFFSRESCFFRTTERWCSCIWRSVYESSKGVSFPREKDRAANLCSLNANEKGKHKMKGSLSLSSVVESCSRFRILSRTQKAATVSFFFLSQ